MIISLYSFFNKKRRMLNKDFVKFIVIKLTSDCHSWLFLFFSIIFTDIQYSMFFSYCFYVHCVRHVLIVSTLGSGPITCWKINGSTRKYSFNVYI